MTAPAGVTPRYATRPAPRFAAWAAVVATLALACAVSVPPSGGPEDKTPPAVSTVVPARDSSGVSVDTPLRISFSEKMTTMRAERLVSFSPEVTIEKAKWDGNTLVVYPEGGLLRDTTYVVTLKQGFKDGHGVASTKQYRFAFATSAHIDSGTVGGTVTFRREPTPNGVVCAYLLPVDTAFALGVTTPSRQAATGEAGRYLLDYLPTSNREMVVWAFEDKNHNGYFDPDGDVALEKPDTVTLTPNAPGQPQVNLNIVDPDEPALVGGRVVNAAGIDTLAVSVALFAPADTLGPSYYALCDTLGAYEFSSVHAGEYVLWAFVDVAPDSVCGTFPCPGDSARACDEPCVQHPDAVAVAPGDHKQMTPIELRPAGER